MLPVCLIFHDPSSPVRSQPLFSATLCDATGCRSTPITLFGVACPTALRGHANRLGVRRHAHAKPLGMPPQSDRFVLVRPNRRLTASSGTEYHQFVGRSGLSGARRRRSVYQKQKSRALAQARLRRCEIYSDLLYRFSFVVSLIMPTVGRLVQAQFYSRLPRVWLILHPFAMTSRIDSMATSHRRSTSSPGIAGAGINTITSPNGRKITPRLRAANVTWWPIR